MLKKKLRKKTKQETNQVIYLIIFYIFGFAFFVVVWGLFNNMKWCPGKQTSEVTQLIMISIKNLAVLRKYSNYLPK